MGARSRLLFIALLAACDSLPATQDGVCGNKVVDSNEDCDMFAAGPGTLCRPPNTPAQCRFACGPQPDGTSAVCPSGMGCGADGTCRSPKGAFTAATQPIPGSLIDLLVGDVDGDGRADVVGLVQGDISTTFYDATLTSVINVHTPSRENSPVRALLRDISGDGCADLIIGAGNGSIVNLGSASRAFVPTAFPSTYIPNLSNASVIVIDTLPPGIGDTLFIMGSYGTVSGIGTLEATGQGALLALLSSPPSLLAGPVATAHLIEDRALSPCDELALSYVGSSEVDIYTACIPDGKGGFAFNDYTSKSPVAITLAPGATVVRGPLTIDVNGDGHLDFLVGASRCSGCDEVDVAYGVGDGTFDSSPTVPASNGNDTFSVDTLITGPLPLALGDLNADGALDFVTPTQVLVSQVKGNVTTFTPQALNHDAPWTEAVIADFNHDAIPDVAAGSSSAPDVSFFVGAGGGTLGAFVIQSAPVQHFAVGDYDGDLVNDLAVAEIAPASDPLGDSVSVLFGNSVGAPSAPISMGHFTSIRQTITGHFTDPFGILSAADLLLTTSTPNATTTDFGSFAGSGDRVLRSPFTMISAMSSSTVSASSAYPWRYAFGHFTNASGPVDVAALDSQYFPAPDPNAPVHRVWLLPTDGEGRFVNATARGGDPIPDGIDWSNVGIVAVDLDGTGTDELVALGPSSTDATKGAVMIARTQPTSSTDPQARLVFGAPSPIDAVVMHDETNTLLAQSGRILTTDLDGDGRLDVVAIATATGATSVVVFWNDHGGQLGAMTTVPNPDGRPPIDFTVIDAGGSGPSLAILTDEGVSLVAFTARVPDVAALAFQVSQGQHIAAGDIDADGVTDLVAASSAGTVVYRGQAVRP